MTSAASSIEPVCVESLMTCDPVTLEPEERLETARILMASCRIRHLPVTRAGILCGMVSARDLASRGNQECVREVMHSPVETLAPEDSILTAAGRLLEHRFSSLPVIERGQVIGIVTSTDLVRVACERLDDDLVSRIMTARRLITVEPQEPIPVAQALMHDQHIRHLPVVVESEIIGFVSDLDLLAAKGKTVVEAMTGPFRKVHAETRASEAGRILIRDRLDALPVVDGSRLVGVLSAFDFLYFLLS